MIYSALLYSSVNNALRGMPPEQSAAIDAIGIADTLFPIVSQAVCEAAAADEYRRSLVLRTKTVTLVAGTATLTSDVLTRYMGDATLLDLSNLNKHYAWREYPDFVRRGDKRLGIFTLKGGATLQVIEPNIGFTSPLTAAGDRALNVPCVIVKPATASTAIDCDDSILSDLDEALAEALRGQIPKQAGQAA